MESLIRLDVNLAALRSTILRGPYVKVLDFAIQEIPQKEPASLALMNVSARSVSISGDTAGSGELVGLCVMLVGKDRAGEILWACCLMGQHRENDEQRLFESLLVSTEILGKTATVSIRMHGGRFKVKTP